MQNQTKLRKIFYVVSKFSIFVSMIDRATVEKILDAAEIVDVVSDFVTLKRRGANYIACCPFHNEKTPSFSVSPSKGIFKCFGCGKAGNAVTFVMEHEQMTYPEALKYIARKYGIEVNETEETEEETADRLRHESMIAVSEFAAGFYADALFNTSEGHAVGLSYLKQRRGFTDETIRKFGIGWSPSGQPFAGESPAPSLPDTALRNGYKKEYLLSTGLCYEHSGKLVDKFRDRVIFPIHSLSGRVIAFGGRTLREDKSVAKYLNSPESEIYHKSNSLYGIYFAKSAIAKARKCYLVEGYTDVISMHQAGIENVTASSGTSLTVGQIRLIKRFTTNVTVLYDGDSAGIKASLRGIDMLLEEGLSVKVALLPDGHDPDSFARTHTRQEILDFLNASETDFIEFKYTLLSGNVENDPISMAGLINDIVATIAVISDNVMRYMYIKECAQRIGVKEEILISQVDRIRRKRIESGEYEKRRREEAEARSAAVGRDTSGESSDLVSGRHDNDGLYRPSSILEPVERELLYYILKYGEYNMVFEDYQLYGAETPVMDITVAEYISAQLEDDDLELQCPLYRKLYDLYFSIRDRLRGEDGEAVSGEVMQDRIMRGLVNCEDPSVPPAVLDITESKYVLTVKEYVKAQIPEVNVLGKNVPKAVLVYKLKCVEHKCSQLSQTLAGGDGTADMQETMHRLKLLLQIRNVLIKDLNRI